MTKNFTNFLILGFFVPILYFPKISYTKGQSAITYVLNGGRFGDNLLNYSKAKWLVYKNPELDFYYLPFQYSDSLKICELEKDYKPGTERNYGRVVRFYADTQFRLDPKDVARIDPKGSCFYISNYYANILVDWKDKNFINELKKTISPCIIVNRLDLPKDKISVAMHVRKGGGYDCPLFSDLQAQNNGDRTQFSDKNYPVKFPPDSFYIEQIKKLYEIVKGAPLYIYIFTDDPNPSRIVDKYKACLYGLNIEFACRQYGNRYDSNVVDDFFAMTQFDCFIRNGSNFSFMVDIIGDFFVVIGLEKAHWEANNWVADKINIKVNNERMPTID